MTNTTSDLESLKALLKATWMAGDFGVVAKHIESHAEDFIARRGVKPGMRVLGRVCKLTMDPRHSSIRLFRKAASELLCKHALDVACGTGNLAIPAARTGAVVTGVDIATNLLAQARARAQSEGVHVQFDEGDAEELPYPDGSFDLVVSMYGAMFAPRPEHAAAELVRVCRPGGQIALANWTPRGFVGQMFKVTAAHVPPPPGMPSPVLWGDEATVRERLRDGVADLRLTSVMVPLKYPFSVPETIEFYRIYFGPTQRAFMALSEDKQAALHHDLEYLWAQHNRATDGITYIEAEYLEVLATRA